MTNIPSRRKTDFDAAANEWRQQAAHLEQKVTALKALQEAARSLSSQLDLDQLLSLILQSAVQVVDAGAGSLLLYDPASEALVFRVVQGGSGDRLLNRSFASDQGIAGAVFTSQQPSIVNDVRLDQRFLDIGSGTGFQATSLMAVPLIHKGDPIGVLEVLNKTSGEPFNVDDQELLLAFAAHSAVAIENARLYREVVTERDRMLVIEEQVRRELARDLHDGPSQLLSAVIMGLRFLREVTTRKPERIPEELDSLEQLSSQALQQIRNMLFNLRPVLLETQGLTPALRAFVDRQRETQDLEIYLIADSFNTRLEPKAEAAIFSIIQEALGNVRKHAQAKHVWITARQKNGQITLSVRDDGCGFDVHQAGAVYAEKESLGLLNMKERAAVANAQLTIDSTPGKGTQVQLVIPTPEPIYT